jgi:hypothetical protein
MRNYEYLIEMEKKAKEALRKDGFNQLEIQSMIAIPLGDSPAEVQIIMYDSKAKEVTYRLGVNSTSKFSLDKTE